MTEKSYRAKVKKTWYSTTNDRHIGRGELVSEDDIEVYVRKGSTGTYYPEDNMLVLDNDVEVYVSPTEIVRI